MSGLGSTRNPRALVPGEPESIDDAVAVLRRYSASYRAVSEDLDKINVHGWSGEANEAFRHAFSLDPGRWRTLADSLTQAAEALSKHANALREAQEKAETAITLWERGEQEARENAARPPATGNSGPAPASTDPGEASREQAQKLLADAQEKLRATGDQVSGSIASQSPRERTKDALAQLAGIVGKAYKPDAGWSSSGPSGNSLGEIKAFAQVVEAHAGGETHAGPVTLQGSTAGSVGANASGSASYSGEGVAADVNAAAGANASAQGGATLGPASTSSSVEGFAGAKAGAHARAGKSGVEASANAFAGARGTATAGADVAGIGISESAEGWAGAGAEAGATFGEEEDGKWKVAGNAGVALGLGGKYGFQVTVDPAKMAKTADEASSAVGRLLQ